ncbi:conserved hypothetical protein [Denitrovibrio acetiphilus DSM 12809]|uniref:Autotransporter domain-containing protein n=1 Tax=Denitrovibrio acetiphilus (strain DSM 12809 / NBRC 114555 / N2460) TaxID=522772 RepID=D4H3J1_DENA2|nr:hypothetical protein [Denitrovibrio acetiphilus]ADD69093.1 conserved hypothetical protein [Denitrovibrio acetiphilus DSM 12809]
MFRKILLTIAAFTLLLPLDSYAGIFNLEIVANPGEATEDIYTQSFSSVEDVIDNLDTDKITQNITNYNEDVTAANATIDFRGVPIYLTMAENSTQITLTIPSIGVTEVFDGVDRDDSVDEMEDWLKENGAGAVTKLMQELAAETPTDPVAGNPTSLQSRMVAMDYMYGVNSDEAIEMNTSGMGNSGSINANMISVFSRYSNYDLDGVSSSSYGLPLAYTVRFDGSKNSLSFRLPISYVDVDGSEAYNFGLGLGFTYFINNDWSMTPAVGYGAVGSVDLASVAQIISGSLTSSYNFHLGRLTLTMGNMAGRYETIPFKYGDYDIDVDIQNTVIRNGLNLNIPSDGLAKDTSFEIFVTDTRYFGSELYVDAYNEIGVSYGFAKVKDKETSKGVRKTMRKLRLGVTYMFAPDVTGYTVNLGFAF